MKTRLLITSLIALVTAVALLASPGISWSINVDFSQLSFDLEGTSIPNTEWGAANLTYTGADPILYFNLTVNNSWQVQNVPVLSREGAGVDQTGVFAFDLGVPRGTSVSSLTYAFTLTPSIQSSMPLGASVAPVVSALLTSFPDVAEEAVPALAPAEPLVGGQAAEAKKHTQQGFPNQDCAKNKCAPAAASNSLQFLKAKNNLNIPNATISIAGMDAAMTNGNAAGAKLRDGAHAWWVDKKAFLDAGRFGITTKQLLRLSDIAAEIDHGEDVELQGGWHTAAIVGITDLGGGKFSLDVAQDTKQGVAGGTQVDTIVFDPATGKFKGSPGFWNGSAFQYAVSESVVPEPSTLLLLGSGLAGFAVFGRKRLRITVSLNRHGVDDHTPDTVGRAPTLRRGSRYIVAM